VSRFSRFAQSLASGYVLLGANVLYTLASVPLALSYLGKAEFGLWALTTSIAGYIGFLDFGLSASASRILIDYKDGRSESNYGSVIQTGALVGITQGTLVFIAGSAIAFVVGPLLKIPQELQRDFIWLMIGQCGLLGFTFAARIWSHILTAHQRYDIPNYASSVLFLVNYSVLWYCFARGLGVFSILWAQGIGTILATVINGIACIRLKLLPDPGKWGRPAWDKFHELFVFGRDFFLCAVGNQLINASQTILLTRLLGLEAAAVWSICTRTYTMLQQVIFRIFDYSSSAIAEMIVRQERQLLLQRFRQIAGFSCSISIAAAVMFVVCNGPFVRLWTDRTLVWPVLNDLLLGVWLIFSASMRVHTGLAGQTKQFDFLRYIYFLEGAAFVLLTLLLRGRGSVTGMLLVSIGCTLTFSFPYGLFRTKSYFQLSWTHLLEWHRSAFALFAWVTPVALIVWWLTREMPLPFRLGANAVLIGGWTLWGFLRHGLGKPLQFEMMARAPGWARPVLLWAGFRGPWK
jgi:O-antigen/teichoic acid export membrane protein